MSDQLTYAARKVLSECRTALAMLDEEEHADRWRVIWVGAMVLLRNVGFLLQNNDGGRDKRIRLASDKLFAEWKSSYDPEAETRNDIFWAFIKVERDQLAHEYNLDSIFFTDSVDLIVESEDEDAQSFLLDGNLFKPMQQGPWEGEDLRDVYSEAIDWWEHQLNKVDQMSAL